jgi:hypothetical protein
MVTVTCYGTTQVFKSRKKAIDFFEEGMMWCDPGSSEFSRYANIVMQLKSGMTDVSDDF